MCSIVGHNREATMAEPPRNNVIPLHGGRRAPREAPAIHDLVQATQAFSRFERCFDALQSEPVRFGDGTELPAVSIQVELPRTRQWLSHLESIHVGNWPDAHWALELSIAVTNASTRLDAANESLSARPLGLGPAQGLLAADMKKLAEALRALRAVIAHRYPEALSFSGIERRDPP
jgi:hypothetical protein